MKKYFIFDYVGFYSKIIKKTFIKSIAYKTKTLFGKNYFSLKYNNWTMQSYLI